MARRDVTEWVINIINRQMDFEQESLDSDTNFCPLFNQNIIGHIYT